MTKLSYVKCCILGHFSDLLCICAAARHVVYTCLQNLIWGPTETASRWLPLPLYLFLVGVFCVFSPHILPFPAPFSLTHWEPNGPALPIVVCVPMWLSPRTTTLAYPRSPTPMPLFFHNWIEMQLFSSATMSGKHARYSVCSHTHMQTHSPTWAPWRPWGNWTKTIPWLSLFTSHRPCSAGVPVLTLRTQSLFGVFACVFMHAWYCKVHLRRPEGPLKGFVCIPESVQVCRGL